MATTTNNTVENSVVDTLEQLLQRSVIDIEFRTELLNNPEAFGLLVETENLVLPKPVAPQDMLFMELVNEAADFAACSSTCISGFTLKCDGESIGSPNCKNTCTTGYTIRCDGNTL
ncbi:cinnamycin family lantibiotic [Microcoleus sp. C2C3]|uniref:cinnamycin family lantibiotic n=1 Tax=unclassified Microcoleus TaxID=2642155 RepID=UPI002FCFF5DC